MFDPSIAERLEGAFPELSKKQLEVSTLYALGASYDVIAESCHLSPSTVKTYLKRSTKSLNLESNDALRTAILLRSFLLVINK